jgi:hypothetical protein
MHEESKDNDTILPVIMAVLRKEILGKIIRLHHHSITIIGQSLFDVETLKAGQRPLF